MHSAGNGPPSLLLRTIPFPTGADHFRQLVHPLLQGLGCVAVPGGVPSLHLSVVLHCTAHPPAGRLGAFSGRLPGAFTMWGCILLLSPEASWYIWDNGPFQARAGLLGFVIASPAERRFKFYKLN